jgi:S1-C subfamily serine protease
LFVIATGTNAEARALAEKEFLKRDWPSARTVEVKQSLVDCAKDRPAQDSKFGRLFYRGVLARLIDAPVQVVDAETERKVRETNEVKAVAKVKDGVVALDAAKKGTFGTKNVAGAGMIIDAEGGYILTSSHVVKDAESITVRFSDKSELSGKLVFADSTRDVAVVKVEPGNKKLKELSLGPSCDLLLNETLISIGSPFGYPGSVVTGHLSSLEDRKVSMPDGHDLLVLQLDANINQGNSGGPVFLLTGRIVGMTAAVRENSRGISFATKTDEIQDTLRENLSAEKVASVRHGITVKGRPLLKDGFLERQELIVKDIRADSPLNKVLKFGDIILKVGDTTFENPNSFDFERALWRYKPGGKVDLTLRRDGKDMVVTFEIPERKK